MSDNENNDDFDLDELDDLDGDFDDLADESWDEYDESMPNEGAAPIQKKTFLQKNFNLIVVGIVVAGACIFAAGQYFSAGESISPAVQPSSLPAAEAPQTGQFDIAETQQQNDDALDISPDLPPVPLPMETDINEGAEQIGLIFEEPDDDLFSEEGALAEDNALTPLPGSFINESESPQDRPEETSETLFDDSLQLDAAAETPSADPFLADDINASIDDVEQDYSDLDDESLDELLNQYEEDLSLSLAEQEDEVSVTGIGIEESNDESLSDISGNEGASTDANIDAIRADFEQQLSNRDVEIDALNRSIASLEQKVIELESTTKAQADALKQEKMKLSEATAKIQAKAKVEAEKTVALPPKTNRVKAAKPRNIQKKNIQKKSWVLRSAQPGKALISVEGSNDMRSIEVGDTLRPIGRVTSISPVDGRWVVQGTKGQINQ